MKTAQNIRGESKALVWTTGAGGLIGNYFLKLAPTCAPKFQVIGLTREQLDLTDFSAVQKKFQKDKPSLVIHCAAMSSSVACQKNPALAKIQNVEVTANLAGLAADIPFVFFSTDLVFDGRAGNYDESSLVSPLSFYGETKVAAEKVVLANPRHTVIRASLNGGTSPAGDRSFNEQLRRAWQAGQTTKLFTDEFRCPIPAEVTARAVWELVSKDKPGLYHVGGSEPLSRFRIGQLIAARWPQLNPKIEPASIKNFSDQKRPENLSLNCAKIQKLRSSPLPGLTEWLKQHPNELF